MLSVDSCENVVFLCRQSRQHNPRRTHSDEKNLLEHLDPRNLILGDLRVTDQNLIEFKGRNTTYQRSLMEKQLLKLVLIPQKSELACLEKLLILRGPPAYV